MVAAGAVRLEREEFLGYEIHRVVPQRAPNLSVFTTEELETVDKVLADLDGLNARQVTELSHEEAGWRLVEEGK